MKVVAGPVHLPASMFVMLVRIWCYMAYPRQMMNFRRALGHWPDPALPGSSNEKYTWRKIFDRNPLFTQASDKLLAKQLARQLCPEVRVPETLRNQRVVRRCCFTGPVPRHLPGLADIVGTVRFRPL